MGCWSECEFGVTTLPPRAYLFAGASTQAKINTVIGAFDNVLFHQHDVYARYLVGGDKAEAAIIFQLYGAPIMCDLMTVLQDGHVNETVFMGYAYGFAEGMRVGDCIIPTRVQTLDGVSRKLGAGAYTAPSEELIEMISGALKEYQIPFRRGKSVSVPATFWHGDEACVDPDVIALELEFAAFCHCAHALGIKAGGLFVISDTRQQGLLDERPPRDPIMLEAFRAIKDYWER